MDSHHIKCTLHSNAATSSLYVHKSFCTRNRLTYRVIWTTEKRHRSFNGVYIYSFNPHHLHTAWCSSWCALAQNRFSNEEKKLMLEFQFNECLRWYRFPFLLFYLFIFFFSFWIFSSAVFGFCFFFSPYAFCLYSEFIVRLILLLYVHLYKQRATYRCLVEITLKYVSYWHSLDVLMSVTWSDPLRAQVFYAHACEQRKRNGKRFAPIEFRNPKSLCDHKFCSEAFYSIFSELCPYISEQIKAQNVCFLFHSLDKIITIAT